MQKGFSLIFVLVAVLLSILAILAVYLISNILNPISTLPLELPPIADPSPSLTSADETTNWKTYENKKYGFSLLIPFAWHITTDPYNLSINIDENSKTFFLSGDEPCIGCGGVPRGITIFISGVSDYSLKDQFFVSHNESSPAFINSLTFKDISINHLVGLEVDGLMGAGCPGPEVWVKSKKYVYTLHTECVDEGIRSQIVESFKAVN